MKKKSPKTEFEKLLAPAENETWRDEVKFREENKEWLAMSADIALNVLEFMSDNKITQKELAIRMGVSPQQVNKIVKGRENLSLQTISKIEGALGIKLITVLECDEMVIKKSVNSFMRKIAFEMLKQSFKKKEFVMKREVTETSIIASKAVGKGTPVKGDYISVSSLIKHAGESNYFMAA